MSPCVPGSVRLPGRSHRGRQMSVLRARGFVLVTIRVHGRVSSSSDMM